VNGVLNLLKPSGPTSHDVVDFVRHLLRVRRAGHTGTLDPGAAGVLPVCLGRATRVTEFCLLAEKGYRAEITFGCQSDSHDWLGNLTPVDPNRAAALTAGDVERALAGLRGPQDQVPPMVSAVKHRGRRLYELARQGRTVSREPRQVTIHEIRLIDFRPAPSPVALFDVVCSRGTYVRTLCHDIGGRLGTGAYMSFLVRTRVAGFTLEDAVTLDELGERRQRGTIDDVVLPPDAALAHLHSWDVDAAWADRLRDGVQPSPENGFTLPVDLKTGEVVRLVHGGSTIALAEVRDGGEGLRLKLRKVLC